MGPLSGGPDMREDVVDRVRALAGRVAASYGLEIFDVEFRREGQGLVLRVRIDRPGPAATAEDSVSIENCAQVSRELSAVLDVEDAISARYSLEVSSPGLNRPLKKESDFARFIGKKAKIRTSRPVGESRRNFSGTLVAVEAGKVKIDVGDQVCEVPVADVEKANLVYEF